MLSLITIPSPSDAVTSIAYYSDGYAQAFMPWVYFIIGVLMAGMFASFVIYVVIQAVGAFMRSRREHNEGVHYSSVGGVDMIN